MISFNTIGVNTKTDAQRFLRLVVPDVSDSVAVLWAGYWRADSKHHTGGWMIGQAFGAPSALVEWSAQKSASGFDTYFALAAFGDQRNTRGGIARTQSNASALRALWLDVDVGKTAVESYETQDGALAALRGFVAAAGLPDPLVVSSGYGGHVYWPLAAEAHPSAWKPVAQSLKNACAALGFNADPSRTADSASVLRLPGTMNHKGGAARPVAVLDWGAGPVALEDVAEKLKPWTPKPATPRTPWNRPADPGATFAKLLEAAPFVPSESYDNFVKAMTAVAAVRPLIGDKNAAALAEMIAGNAPEDARERNDDPRYSPAALASKAATMPPEAGVGVLLGMARDVALGILEAEHMMPALSARGRLAAEYLARHHLAALKAHLHQWTGEAQI